MITKILLADSSEEFRLLLRHTLEDTGEFQIVGDTGDGEAAWELIQQTQPDIVVMDVILPGLDGVSLLQRMPKNVKTIVLSAFCSQNIAGGHASGRMVLHSQACPHGFAAGADP